MLDQDSKKTFNRSKERAMHHHRPMRLVVFADVLKLETLRQIKVPLHRTQLPQTADGVLDLEIYLGAVESSFAFHALVVNSASVKPRSQRGFCVLPQLV